MAGLRLFTSNRLEILADKLAVLLRTPLASPLTPEVIVVQSRGMERWLSMEIARRQGICANFRFPFPQAFAEEAFAAVSGVVPETEAFAPEVMAWKLMKIIPSFLEQPGFEQLRRYLKGKKPPVPVPDGESNSHAQARAQRRMKITPTPPSPIEGEGYREGGHFHINVDGRPVIAEGDLPGAGDVLKRFQLASRVARLFDQYLIFRPEMMTAWEKGETAGDEESWQSELWRALIAGETASHPAARKEAFLREINLSRAGLALPERVFVFGISTLPRFHLSLFHALSQKMEVNMFLMNPSREFWGDIRSDREKDRAVARVREARGDYTVSGETLYLERGNRLLASLGTLGREFFSLIWEFYGEEGEYFEDPGERDLLSAVQSDILNLRDRGAKDRKVIAPDDRSVQFHSCHSPLREIEALYDKLLSLFEEDTELLPRDIMVMAPDIEVYAPLIKAVFDRPPDVPGASLPRLPFTIADRGSLAESSVIAGFMKALEMAGGRFGAGQVLSLLSIPETGARFDITTADLELIRRWVKETGIRWGIDGENRRRLGLPALRENTWQEGLERLLMGYAMPGRGFNLVDGILPCDLEGGEAAVLGRFLEYTEALFSRVTALTRPRTIGAWSLFLAGLLDGLFAPREDGEAGMEKLKSAFLRLQELEDLSGFEEPVDISVIKTWLAGFLAEKGFGHGFLAGGVTFCAMLPMRSIPFPVICLLGMNGADYPRRSWAPAFDLMARHPQPADRSRRKDDRYLFLEALLSARKRLIVSYVGQSSEDNSPVPPSVLVTELLDYLQEGFALPGGGDIKEALVTRHRLQAFSPAYFQGKDGLFSYSAENWRAACCLVEKKEPVPASAPLLSPPEEAWRQVALPDLAAFFADPVRYFFRRRLDLRIDGDSDLPEEREPFQLEGLEKYDLEQQLVEAALAGRDLQDCREAARAAGRLPHGAVGVSSYRTLRGEAQGFAERVKPFLAGKEASRLTVDLPVAGFRLQGEIPLYEDRLVHFRYATLKPRDHLRLWLFHLLLNMLSGGAAAGPSILLGKGESWRYAAPPHAEGILTVLLDKYWEGLSQPLKFFPLASWEYGKAVFQAGKPREEGLKRAAQVWQGSDFQDGEGEEPFFRICFGGGSPLDEEFEKTAEAILSPLFHYREKIKDGEI